MSRQHTESLRHKRNSSMCQKSLVPSVFHLPSRLVSSVVLWVTVFSRALSCTPRSRSFPCRFPDEWLNLPLRLQQEQRTLLSSANEVWGKVIFLHLSVILFTGGAGTPRDQRHVTPRDQAPPPHRSACWEIRPTSGRYASYWNAILFQ